MKQGKTMEPLWWGLFSAGGVVAALFVPVHIFLQGLAAPSGLVAEDLLSYERMVKLTSHPLAKLYLFVLIALPLFHWAHRFRFLLVDTGLKALKGPIAFLCYGSAIAGAILAAVVLLRFP